jgi:hypothetical protein
MGLIKYAHNSLALSYNFVVPHKIKARHDYHIRPPLPALATALTPSTRRVHRTNCLSWNVNAIIDGIGSRGQISTEGFRSVGGTRKIDEDRSSDDPYFQPPVGKGLAPCIHAGHPTLSIHSTFLAAAPINRLPTPAGLSLSPPAAQAKGHVGCTAICHAHFKSAEFCSGVLPCVWGLWIRTSARITRSCPSPICGSLSPYPDQESTPVFVVPRMTRPK